MKRINAIIALLILVVCYQNTLGNNRSKQISPVDSITDETNGEIQLDSSKPTNDWSVGMELGSVLIHGDVIPLFDLSYGLTLERSICNSSSIRGNITYGHAKGLNWFMNSGIYLNPALNGENNLNADYATTDMGGLVFYNFRTSFVDFNVSGILGLGALLKNTPRRKWDIELLLGGSAMFYKTKIDALDNNGNPYDYLSVSGGNIVTPEHLDTKSKNYERLKELLDKNYETEAEVNEKRKILNMTPAYSILGGLGFKYNLSERASMRLQFYIHKTYDDLIDGHRWTETYEFSKYPDWYSYSGISFIMKLVKANKRLDHIPYDDRDQEYEVEKAKIMTQAVDTTLSPEPQEIEEDVVVENFKAEELRIKTETVDTVVSPILENIEEDVEENNAKVKDLWDLNKSMKYHIVIGSFTNFSNAKKFSEILAEQGVFTKTIEARIEQTTFYRVTIGSYKEKQIAIREHVKLKGQFDNSWIMSDDDL
ncbi:MAG: SPOR domain-containing protein [Bacteroidetes bacterium]|nr:SPOR domain-containing protein [Bacteroidota bacterium]